MKALRILALLFIASPCFSQSLPEAPKPNRRIFLAGTALLGAAKAADVWTTKDLLARGGWENNPTVGSHPSTPHLAGHAAAIFGAQSTAFYFTEHNRWSWVRWIGRAYIGLAIEEHARLAACNASINVQSFHVQNCHSFMPF